MYREEEKRIDEQKAQLGDEGLMKKQEILEAAISSQNLPSNQVSVRQTKH